jgi:hypothetical protein
MSTLFHRVLEGIAVADNVSLNEFTQQVITLTGTLAHTSKYRQTRVGLGHVVDKLLNQYGFTYTSTTEQTNFATLHIRSEQVDYFDTSEEYFRRSSKVFKCGSIAVNGQAAGAHRLRNTVDSLANYVEKAAFHTVAGGHRDSVT